MSMSDLRCFVALAGILPVIRYIRTCRFNTLGAISIAPASVRFCSHACFWCNFDCTSECAILIAPYILVGLTLPPHIPMRIWFNNSDLTERSGLVTRVASDLGWAHQKYPCTVRSIINLRHLPPQMKNQHGLNEEKTFIGKK